MTRSNRGHLPLRLVVVAALALGSALGLLAAPAPARAADPALPAWDGGIDLYRDGTFTTQKSWLWCTAAGVQIVRNIVDDQEDHSTGGQRRYFNWMRQHNRYTLPLSAGVDPQGWTAGLRHFVDDRYRLVSSRTFAGALRLAVKRLRLTNLPVALTVSHGNHGWILTGFTATADPSGTAPFEITSVRVVGPLYGLQSRNGYDMPPDTKLTPTQLKRYFTPWRYAPKRMIWDGRYVSIQPVPVAATAAASPAASTSVAPSAEPSAAASTDGGAAAIATSMPTVLPSPAMNTEPRLTRPEPGTAAGEAGPAGETGPAAVPVAIVAMLATAGVLILAVLARRLPWSGKVSSAGSQHVRSPR